MGLSPDEQNALDSLNKDQSILICKPDKGDGVVIMDKVDYYRKMDEMLKDTSKFRKINCDSNITNLTKFQQFLYYSKPKQNFNDEVYARVRPSAAVTPTLYGILKLHKPGIQCRPILASTGNLSMTVLYSSMKFSLHS